MKTAVLLPLLCLLLAGPARAGPQIVVSPTADLIFAEVEVDGRPGMFLVDTGAATSIISSDFASRGGLRLGRRGVIAGSGGAANARVADDVVVRARGGPAFHLNPPVTDLGEIARAFGRPFDGILGSDYFGRLVLVLDYRAGKASFLPPDTPQGAGSIPIARIVATPYVHGIAEKDGRRLDALFQIDTGSNTAVGIWTPVSRKVFPGVRGRAAEGIGVGGDLHQVIASLDAMEFLGKRFTGLEADFTDALRPDDAPPDYGGFIGGPAFAGKVLTIDYARGRVSVE